MQEPPQQLPDPHRYDLAIQSVPYAFAAIAGAIYAIGFLVEFSFLATFGIREVGAEAFKAKYIYIGLLCLQFPVSFVVTLLGFIRLMQAVKENQKQAQSSQLRMYIPSLLTLLNLLFAFYLLNAFARPGLFHERQYAIGFLFGLMIIGLILAKGVEDKIEWQRKKNRWIGKALNFFNVEDQDCRKFWSLARWLVLCLSIGLTVWVFWTTWKMLWEMFIDAGWLHFGFLFLAALMWWRIQRKTRAYAAIGVRTTVLAISIAITTALTYLAILFFAYRVYPYIPANRGGGDYSTERTSVLTFDRSALDSIPEELIDRTTKTPKSKPLMILHESGSHLFLTLESDGLKWRRSGRESKPQTIYSLRRESVVSNCFTSQSVVAETPFTPVPSPLPSLPSPP